jgi:transcriptional regulator with XRE-family HTH domain
MLIVMDVKAVFGANLKFYRKQNELSQEELAEKAGISVKHLSTIERGLAFVSADLLEKLSSSLQVPVSTLFYTTGDPFGNDRLLEKFDKIVKNELAHTLETIKTEIRRDN